MSAAGCSKFEMQILFEHALFLPHADAQPQPDMCVGVSDGVIAFVGARPPETFSPDRRIDCCGALLMPGFVNAHTHSPLSLLRSGGEGLPLQRWLEQVVWPYEAQHTAESCYWGTLLNAAECIRAGITCVCDMYIYPQSVAKAMSEAGLRALVTPTVTDALLEKSPDLLTQIVRLREQWAGHPLIHTGIAPHAVYTCEDKLLSAVSELAEAYDLPIHVHVSETACEQQECSDRYGTTPLVHLDRLGLITSRTLMAHCVWLSPADIDLAARRGATVVHCPRSNLKLGSGIAPVEDFIQAGIPVALGTDSSASNNSQDILEEMRFASLLQKGTRGDPTVLSPARSLAMATSAAGKAAGFSLGRLAPGEPADLILVSRREPHWQPGLDPRADLLYAASASDVVLTMVNGVILYENGVFQTVDLERIYRMLPHFYPRVMSQPT